MKRDAMLSLMKKFYNKKVVTEGVPFEDMVGDLLAEMEQAGMKAPSFSKEKELMETYAEYLENDGCHGNVCKYSWRNYQTKVPKELLPYLQEVNMGDYTIVMLNAKNVKGWE